MTDERDVYLMELVSRPSCDTTPLVSLVVDQPYSRGSITSESRTASPAYQEFLRKARENAERRT